MKNDLFLNLGIIIGGCSVEHEISLISGLQSILNVNKKKYNAYPIMITKDNKIMYLKNFYSLDDLKNKKNFKKATFIKIENEPFLKVGRKKIKLDVVIPVVHGKGVEDGTISSILEFINIPYTSAGIMPCAISQNKDIAKRIAKTIQVKTLPFIKVKSIFEKDKILKFIKKYKYPIIIKPTTLGSSIGIKVVKDSLSLDNSLIEALKYDDSLIIEPLLKDFTEYNMAAYKKGDEIVLSLIEEVKSENDILTFNDKYVDRNLKDADETNRIIPAKLDKELENKIKDYTLSLYEACEFFGVIRIDYLYDKINKVLYFNEINAIPGSLAFYLFKDTCFENLLDDLIKEAILRFKKKQTKITSFNTNILDIKKLKAKK